MIDDLLRSRYPELEQQLHDPAAYRLVNDLDMAYAANPPPRVASALRAALDERATAYDDARPADRRNMVTGRNARRSRLSRHPALLTAALLALVALIGGTSFLAVSALTRHEEDPGGNWPALLARNGTPVGTFAQMCGFTVTVNRAYADANDVLVEYTISPPAGRYWIDPSADVSLQGERGKPMRMVIGFGLPPDRHGARTTIDSFDASGIKGSPRSLYLEFVVQHVHAFEQVGSGKPPVDSCQQGTNTGPGANRNLLPTITYSSVQGGTRVLEVAPPRLNGPPHFGFTVPFAPYSRVAILHRVVHVGESWLEIDRVVVTPSETRVYVRGKVQDVLLGPLTVGGRQVGVVWQGLAGVGLTAYSYEEPLYNQHGEWQISLPPTHPGDPDQHVRFTVP